MSSPSPNVISSPSWSNDYRFVSHSFNFGFMRDRKLWGGSSWEGGAHFGLDTISDTGRLSPVRTAPGSAHLPRPRAPRRCRGPRLRRGAPGSGTRCRPPRSSSASEVLLPPGVGKRVRRGLGSIGLWGAGSGLFSGGDMLANILEWTGPKQ